MLEYLNSSPAGATVKLTLCNLDLLCDAWTEPTVPLDSSSLSGTADGRLKKVTTLATVMPKQSTAMMMKRILCDCIRIPE